MLTAVLLEEYGALPDPEPDDNLHSELDWPQIERLRAVISPHSPDESDAW